MRIKFQNIFKQMAKGLASNKNDLLISLIISLLIAWVLFKSLFWVLNDASWGVITENIGVFTFGSYPLDETWRPITWISILVILTLLTLSLPRSRKLRKILPTVWILMVPIGVVLLSGGFVLKPVNSSHWGGLTLTLLLTACSGAIALPLGIILAIGRQSRLFIITKLCGGYIDVMRSIPLIAVLFFGQLLIPLFLPVDLEINRVLRAIFAFAFFAAAYIAEDIRGGLQSISKTQEEAAYVLGLNKRQTIQYILLPQALRIALPSLTNQAVGLIQNTSLMAILGLVELLGISRSLLANPEFIGRHLETYLWLGLIYWVICTAMALLSRNLEKQLQP